jgi:hypothetical protein
MLHKILEKTKGASYWAEKRKRERDRARNT